MDLKLTLSKPLKIGEGEGAIFHKEIDLGGLENLTGKDVIFCRKEAARKGGAPGVNHIYDDAYRLEVMAKVTGIAAEALVNMSARDFEGADAMVQNFFTGADSVEESPPTK